MKTSSFRNKIKEMLMMAVLLISIASCNDDPIVKDYNYDAFTPDGSLNFCITVPDYALPTRVTGDAEDIDTTITTLHLYLFDEKGGFIGIVEADEDTEHDSDKNLDPGEKDKVIGDDTKNATGYYKANIPQNTDIIHFVANAPQAFTPGYFDLNRHKGMREEEVFLPMLTTDHIYWGTSTYNELTTRPNPVVLYRNYAKVRYRLGNQSIINNTPYIIQINGWKLCNVPQNSLVAPYDGNASTQPFHFNLTDSTATGGTHRYAAVPAYNQRKELLTITPLSATATSQVDNTKIVYTDNQEKALPIFDHSISAYSDFLNDANESKGVGDARVFAIFHITTAIYDGSNTTYEHKFYKILFMKNVDDGASQTFDIKRNHIYTIRFEGINPDLGWDSFDEAVAGPPANASEITVEETLPEVQSSNATLRVVNGTVRYIDNLEEEYMPVTDNTSLYNVNDIHIYYSGTETAAQQAVSDVLEVAWVSGSWVGNTDDEEKPESSSIVCKYTPSLDGTYSHTISFNADAFNYGDNGKKYYKEGFIRVTEKLNDGVLSRYIRVYIGEPVPFRPLLISSDIPSMSDERITVAFTVPDSLRLPTTLYPIEIRFGSDQVDVEKNLYTESMKVDLVSTAYEDNLLQYTNVVDGITQSSYGWYANGQAGDNWTDWGYKYTYTIEEPADSGEHRITLRTVYDDMTDFSVVMEGLSTVLLNGMGDAAKADIFNTRELKFNVLSEKTMATARRIMLDDGLYDTRLTSAYVNINKSDGATSVNIPYTLGYYDPNDEGGEGDYMTPATLSTGVNLWVYYRPEDLTPSGTWATLNSGKPFVDAEGNHFAKIENTTNSKGTLTFTFTDNTKDVKNSLVFITARSGKDDDTGTHPYGGTYTGAALGAKEHVYTGVNAETNAWRSASALVSVLSDWKFNPAPTEIADYNFEYADEMERNYGVSIYKTDYDFLVRIDRPSGTSDIKLAINTGGNLQLIEEVDISEYTLDAGYYETIKTTDGAKDSIHRSLADTNGDIHLTLTDDQSSFCILRFRPLRYDHSGTITFKDITTSGAIYNNETKNTLKITHSPLTIVDHKYMWRDDYMLLGDKSDTPDDIAETEVSDDQFYENLRVDENTAGQEFVVRLYFPNGIRERSTDKDENDKELTFSFKFTSNGAKVINPTGTGKANFYTVDDEGIVTVTGKPLSITHSDISCAYVDIFLRTTESVTTENFRITSGNDLLFYRYVLGEFSIRTESTNGGGKVLYEISNDKTNWMTIAGGTDYFNTSDTKLANIYDDGQTFYLRVTLKNYVNKVWNPAATKDRRTDLTLKTSGFKVVTPPTGSVQTTSPDSEQKQYRLYTYRFNNAQWAGVSDATDGTGRSIVVKLQTESTGLAEYIQLETRTDMSDEKTDWGAILDRTAILMGTQTTNQDQDNWELYFSGGNSINDNRNGSNNMIFDVNAPVNTDQKLTKNSIEYFPIKIDRETNVSFYAPHEGMDITIGVAKRQNSTDNTYSNGDYAIYQVNATGQTALHSNASVSSETEITEYTYTLGTAGLYRLQAIDKQFYLYYIKLVKNKLPGSLGAVTWEANRLSNNPKANATWGGDDATFTATDNVADITLSAFAEKLTLTFPNITEAPFNMRLLGDEFRIFTPDGLVTELTGLEKTDTLTIVPTNGGVLEHLDKIQLEGESGGYFYKQDITLKLRPYMKMTSNLNFDTFDTIQIWEEKNSRYEDYVHLQVGDELSFTFTYVDNSIETENVQFGLGEYGSNTSLTATAPEGWTKNNLYTINNPGAGDERTFNLKATSATTGTLAVVRGTSSCDVYSGDTLTGVFFLTDNYENLYPKIHITGVSITYDWGSYTDAEGQLPKDSVTGSGAEYTLPAKNFTLYKEGYTLTGWSDGRTTYNPGATLSVSSNVILTPVFTQNTVSLDDRTEPVTIKWDFQRDNGAPTINGWQGTDGHVWVAQAEVNDQTIDVKMDVNTTSGKFANASWGDWCQLNNGTILTTPSCNGATVEMNAYNEISTTTINGETGYTAGNTITATVSGSDATTDIVIGDGGYYSYVQVTLPVVANQYTVTYYNEGYTTYGTTYTQFAQQTYWDGGTIGLPSEEPTSSNRTFSHWVTVAGNGVRTKLTGGESVTGDMVVYPVWDVAIGASDVTVLPGDVAEVSKCVTKGTFQLIDCAYNDGYILFDVVPSETGWYTFTANIATALSDRTVTLGYESDQNSYVTQNIEANCDRNWNIQTEKTYDWTFYLTAGNTYTFKMICNKLSSATDDNGYTANVNSIIVKKGATFANVEASAVWAFNNIKNYATAYTTTPEGVFSSVSVNTGDLTIITETGTGQAVDENGIPVTFVKLKPAGTTTAVEWSVKPTEGLTFTPTKVTGYIQRFGTDAENGVTVTARLADGTSLELGNFTAPRNNKTQAEDKYGSNSNYTNQFIIELTAEQQETLTSTDGFTLSATVGVGSTKEGGFSDVQIHGTVTGTIE